MPRRHLTPTTFARAASCLHSWYLETHVDADLVVEPDAGLELLFERGLAHERRMIETLTDVVEPEWDGRDYAAGHAATVALLREGRPWVAQGPLMREDARGVPDLLQRLEGRSALGDFTYVPVDVKGHKTVEKGDRFQLHLYAHLLEPVLGKRPATGGIWLNSGAIETVDLGAEEFRAHHRKLERVRRGAHDTLALKCTACNTCPWSVHCADAWLAEENVTLLAGVRSADARKLTDAGFPSWRDVARTTPAVLVERAGVTVKKAQAVYDAALAWESGEPRLLQPVTFPASAPVIYYDIETYGATVYLHGLVRVDGDHREERQFAARTPDDEARIWHELLDYMAGDAQPLVYCWAPYEFRFVERLWSDYGGNAAGYRHFRAMQDQCAFVKRHFALPTTSYSIKHVAPAFGFHWDAEDAGGLNSEAWYGQWLETGDEALFEKIMRYNLDDVRAMEAVDRALRERFG